MAAGAGVDRHLDGNFSFRVMHYKAICGSLTVDLAMGCFFFFVFGCCAGTETAITTLWPWKVRELAQREVERAEEKGSTKYGMWSALRSDIQRFMQTILIGATLSGVFSTAFVTEICAQLFGGSGLAIATMSVSVLQLIFCEIVPKGVAVCNACEFASLTLPIYYWISSFVYPIGRQLNLLVENLLRLLGISIDASKTPYISEEELDLMLQSAMRTGILETEEGKMISSVRELDTKRVNDIMVPLVDMICINTSESLSGLHEVFSQTQYSRLPVYKDRFDNVVGIVSMKTLLRKVRFLEKGDWETLTVDEICDRPFFVPETMTVLNLLQYLKERPIAVCVDEYGGTTGLVTLEDVLEEIVGEIYDPDVDTHKQRGKRRSDQIQDLGDGCFAMTAATDIDDVSMGLGVALPEGNYNSIGGFMADVADRIPLEGEVVLVRTSRMNVRFEAMEVDERKVVRIQAQRIMLDEDGPLARSSGEDSSEAEDEDISLARVLAVTLQAREESSATDDEPGGRSSIGVGMLEVEPPLASGEDGTEVARPLAPKKASRSSKHQLPSLDFAVLLGAGFGGILGGSLESSLDGSPSRVVGGGILGAILGGILSDVVNACYLP